MSIHRLARFGLASLVLVSISACSDDDKNPTAPVTQGNVMVAHASPDAPAVDVLVDGTVVRTGLAYPGNTSYITMNAGTHNLELNLTGTTTTAVDVNVPVTAGASYTLFAGNEVGSIEPVVFTDTLTATATGKARVRFIHLAPDAPAVDLAVMSGNVMFANRAFKQASAFTEVNGGTYDLEARIAGSGTVVVPMPDVTFVAGKVYTLFTRGLTAGVGAQALGYQMIVHN